MDLLVQNGGQSLQNEQPAESYFDGSSFGLVFLNIGCFLLNILTLWFASPWTRCMKERWYAKHTVYNGNRCYFDGTGGQMFVKNILWNFLTIITLFIFLIFKKNRMRKWVAKHTHFANTSFADATESKSKFTGSTLGSFFTGVLVFVVSVITLGLGFCAMTCYRQRWLYKHTIIDGQQLEFNGKGMQFFGKFICWVLLGIVTVGIYLLFLPVKSKKWKTKHAYIKALGLPSVPENEKIKTEKDLTQQAILLNTFASVMLMSFIVLCGAGLFTSFQGLHKIAETCLVGIVVVLFISLILFILSIRTKRRIKKKDSPEYYALKKATSAVRKSGVGAVIAIGIIGYLTFYLAYHLIFKGHL